MSNSIFFDNTISSLANQGYQFALVGVGGNLIPISSVNFSPTFPNPVIVASPSGNISGVFVSATKGSSMFASQILNCVSSCTFFLTHPTTDGPLKLTLRPSGRGGTIPTRRTGERNSCCLNICRRSCCRI